MIVVLKYLKSMKRERDNHDISTWLYYWFINMGYWHGQERYLTLNLKLYL